MRDSKEEDEVYKLEIYGSEEIEQETRYFERLSDGIESIKGRISEDHNGWKFSEDRVKLVDKNGNGPAVINRITKVAVDELGDDVHIWTKPVYGPDATYGPEQ